MKTPHEPLTPEERALAQSLSRLGPHGGPSPGLDARILAAARAAVQEAPAPGGQVPPPRRRWPLGLGVAASVLLAAGVAWQLRPAYEVPVASEVPAAAPVHAPAGVIDSAEADIKSVAKELNLFKTMVDKGIALPARQGDLERMLRSYSAARLDVSADAMRAKQNISEASRNLEGLYDRQRTEVNIELQTEQANLDQMLLKREVAQKQMLKILSYPNTPLSVQTMVYILNMSVM